MLKFNIKLTWYGERGKEYSLLLNNKALFLWIEQNEVELWEETWRYGGDLYNYCFHYQWVKNAYSNQPENIDYSF